MTYIVPASDGPHAQIIVNRLKSENHWTWGIRVALNESSGTVRSAAAEDRDQR